MIIRRCVLLAALGLSVGCQASGLIVYAQALPYVATATWPPNPATDNVLEYRLTLDGGVPVVIPASACAATCTSPLSVPAFGAHTAALTAWNRRISTDPTSLQSSGPSSTLFTLTPAPGPAGGLTVR